MGREAVKFSVRPETPRHATSILATARIFQRRRRLAYASSKAKQRKQQCRSILQFYKSVTHNKKTCRNLFLRKRTATWTEAHDKALVRRMQEYTIDHCHLRIGIDVWEEWARKFEADFGAPVTISQLISRQNRLKRYFECYRELLTDIRLGLDEFRAIMCSAERWAVLVQKSLFANKVKLDGIENYEMLHDIFAGRNESCGKFTISSVSSNLLSIGSQGEVSSHAVQKKKWKRTSHKARIALKSVAETFKCHYSSRCTTLVTRPKSLRFCRDILSTMSLSGELCSQALTLMTNNERCADAFGLIPESRRFSFIKSIVDEHNQNTAGAPTPGPFY